MVSWFFRLTIWSTIFACHPYIYNKGIGDFTASSALLMQNAEAVEIWKRRFITDLFYSQRKHRCLDSTDSDGGGSLKALSRKCELATTTLQIETQMQETCDKFKLKRAVHCPPIAEHRLYHKCNHIWHTTHKPIQQLLFHSTFYIYEP